MGLLEIVAWVLVFLLWHCGQWTYHLSLAVMMRQRAVMCTMLTH